MSVATVYLGLTIKPHRGYRIGTVTDLRRSDQNERSRFTPTLRAVALINAQASSGSGTPV
jgi:hypothetical protein